MSVLAFLGNLFDDHSVSAHLEQIGCLTGYTSQKAVMDRGYWVKKEVS